MFGVLGWILFGLIVGVIAKLLMPGRDPGGFIVTVLLGIAGALVAGFLGRAIGLYGPNDGAGYIMSIIGAVLLLFAYRKVCGADALNRRRRQSKEGGNSWQNSEKSTTTRFRPRRACTWKAPRMNATGSSTSRAPSRRRMRRTRSGTPSRPSLNGERR